MRSIKVNLRESYAITDNVIEKILRMRGVKKKDVAKYLFPDESLKPDYNKLDNIDEAVELLHSHIEKNSKIMVVSDGDYDGLSSASIMYQYLTKDLGYPDELVHFYMHEGKVHGIPESVVLESNPDLLIMPDASSSEFDIHKRLFEQEIDLLVLDHHLVNNNEYSQHALVVNNQLSERFPWKSLTGANMVYLFCEAYSDKYNGGKDISHYDDLNFSGMLADRASLLDLAVYYYYNKGAGNIQNPLLKEIIKKSKNIEEGERLTPKDIGWSVAPFFNSVIRNANPENLKLVADAINGKEYEVYNKRLKDDFPVVTAAMRAMTNDRAKQSKRVKEAREKIQERIEQMGTDKHKVILVNATDIIEDSAITGLVATQIANEYNKPAMIMKYYSDRNVLSGSMRNFNNSPILSFKDVMEETGMFNFVAGHENAAGFELDVGYGGQITEALNEALSDIEYDNLLHTVDLRYSQKPDAEEILEIAKHDWLWGQDLSEPKVHIEDIQISKEDIQFIGAKGNVWKLDLQSCEGIMFSLTEQQKLKLTNHEEDILKIEIVGTCSVNDFRGQKRPQIIIEDFSVVGLEDFEVDPWNNFEVEVLPF